MTTARFPLLLTLTIGTLIATTTPVLAASKFHAKEYPVKIHAQSSNDTFKIEGGEVTCSKNNSFGVGPVSEDTNQIKLHPEYTGCTAKVGGFKSEASLETHQCQYIFYIGPNQIWYFFCSPPPFFQIQLGLAPGCTITIGETGNKELQSVIYSNLKTTPKTIEAAIKLSGITYEVKECLGVIKSGKTGTYVANSKIEAQNTKTGKQVDLETI